MPRLTSPLSSCAGSRRARNSWCDVRLGIRFFTRCDGFASAPERDGRTRAAVLLSPRFRGWQTPSLLPTACAVGYYLSPFGLCALSRLQPARRLATAAFSLGCALPSCPTTVPPHIRYTLVMKVTSTAFRKNLFQFVERGLQGELVEVAHKGRLIHLARKRTQQTITPR